MQADNEEKTIPTEEEGDNQLKFLPSQRKPRKGKVKRLRYRQIVEDYKELDLKLYVIRQAHASNATEIRKLCTEEKRVWNTQQAILLELENAPIKTMEDALVCLDVWYLETIKSKKLWELSVKERIMKKVRAYLRSQLIADEVEQGE